MNLIYGDGEYSLGKENFYLASNDDNKFDFIIMTDSRGAMTNSLCFENSFIYLLKCYLNSINKSYLIISRPKNLTVFSTLNNFLELNNTLKFKYLITNLGFVDFTPKKQNNIDDILFQVNQFSKSSNNIIEHESYQLSDKTSEILKSMEYTKEYVFELNNCFSNKFKNCYFINTPIVSEDIKMERKRPKSFFTQLHKTNKFIDDIIQLNNKHNLIDIKDLAHTYDGVHYTDKGHNIIFNKIKESINL